MRQNRIPPALRHFFSRNLSPAITLNHQRFEYGRAPVLAGAPPQPFSPDRDRALAENRHMEECVECVRVLLRPVEMPEVS
jgi:hypothetical protein